MPKRLVDVLDRSGAKLFTYTISLEEEACLDEEFEEVALIFAERSGLVADEELPQLTARCETPVAAIAEARTQRRGRSSTNVLSLIKHRMKKTPARAAGAHAQRRA